MRQTMYASCFPNTRHPLQNRPLIQAEGTEMKEQKYRDDYVRAISVLGDDLESLNGVDISNDIIQ
jgi:hypothetical protein